MAKVEQRLKRQREGQDEAPHKDSTDVRRSKRLKNDGQKQQTKENEKERIDMSCAADVVFEPQTATNLANTASMVPVQNRKRLMKKRVCFEMPLEKIASPEWKSEEAEERGIGEPMQDAGGGEAQSHDQPTKKRVRWAV